MAAKDVKFNTDARDRMLKVDETQSLAIWLRDTDWALSELPTHQREAVLLASQGVYIVDGAAQLGIAAGTFKSRIARGRTRLRAPRLVELPGADEYAAELRIDRGR